METAASDASLPPIPPSGIHKGGALVGAEVGQGRGSRRTRGLHRGAVSCEEKGEKPSHWLVSRAPPGAVGGRGLSSLAVLPVCVVVLQEGGLFILGMKQPVFSTHRPLVKTDLIGEISPEEEERKRRQK